MQHWGETEAESAVAGLHSPEVEGCFAVAELCFSCAARHCCSSGLRFSTDFSGVSAVAFPFFAECPPSSPFLALVSVGRRHFPWRRSRSSQNVRPLCRSSRSFRWRRKDSPWRRSRSSQNVRPLRRSSRSFRWRRSHFPWRRSRSSQNIRLLCRSSDVPPGLSRSFLPRYCPLPPRCSRFSRRCCVFPALRRGHVLLRWAFRFAEGSKSLPLPPPLAWALRPSHSLGGGGL